VSAPSALPPSASNQLEFLAEFQVLRALQIHLEVGVGGIAICARPSLRRKVHAVGAGKTQLEARGFLAKPKVDRRSHLLLKRLRWLSALEEEVEIASHATGHRGSIFGLDHLTRIGEICNERSVRQTSF